MTTREDNPLEPDGAAWKAPAAVAAGQARGVR